MMCGTGKNRAGGMEGNGGSVPTQWEEVDSSRKYVAFLMCNATWPPVFFGNSLKLGCNFGIMGLRSNRSVSGNVFKRSGMLSVKSNGKSQLIGLEIHSANKILYLLGCLKDIDKVLSCFIVHK